MRSAGRWFPQFILGLIILVIVLNVIAAAVQPYLGVIGVTFTILLIGVALVVAGFIAYGIVQFVRSRADKTDIDNLGLGGWE